MLRVLIPGSFDPPTYGHLNLVERAARIYDEVDVVIAHNALKAYTFTAEERTDMLRELFREYTNVHVHVWEHLIVRLAEELGARIMIRGVRALDDFSYEFELSMLNKGLNPDIETIFMPTDPQYFVLRSSSIKELVRLGGDVSGMVPPLVEKMLEKRIPVLGQIDPCT